MPKSKLPKGAQSLGDIARMRGRGGQRIRHIRKTYLGIAESPKGKRYESRMGKFRGYSQEAAELMYKQQSKAYHKPDVSPKIIEDISSARLRGSEAKSQSGYGDLIGSSKFKVLAKAAGKMSAIGQIITLPSQIKEYKQHMKPLSKKEQERSARGI